MPVQLPLELPHHPSLAREDLIVTASNELAVAAIDSWPCWKHPLLLIVGPAGSGKTHIASAWAELAGASALPPQRIGPSPAGRESFAVVVDDIDRDGLDETGLFHLINAARLGGGALLLTSRRRPPDMPVKLPDLRSRLKAATIVELGAPDEVLLEGVLAKLFADRQIMIDPRVLSFLSRRMERSLEDARRLVAEIDRAALASKGKITRTLLREAVAKLYPQGGNDGHEGDAEPRHIGAAEGHSRG